MNLGTNLGEKFAASSVKLFFEEAVAPMITNQDWEGEIKGGGADRVNILTFGAISLQDYTPGTPLNLDTPTESEGSLVINQQKGYRFKINSLLKFEQAVNDQDSTLLQNASGALTEAVDAFILGLEGDVAAGQRVGTDYTTGTVTVDVTTGLVTGSGTTFTAAMVGKGFKAAGHTVWYRVKTYTSATSIVIEDDLDDVATAYTGGAIGAGATYTIEAATKVTVDASNIYAKVIALKTKLDQAKVPKRDRWLVVNSAVSAILLQSSVLTRAVESDTSVIRNGMIGRLAGFDIYENEQVAGNNTTGYKVLAGHKSWCTFAFAFTETGIEDISGEFGKAYKGLTCYGAKVLDERRKAGASLLCTV
jgi:hypothetical protein